MVYPTSLFSQVLSLISKSDFYKNVRELKADKASKGFSCWDQLVSMLFCQLAQARSLREICYGLRCCLGKLIHLGVSGDPKRSTLSYANAHRPWQLYQSTFYSLLELCRAAAPGKKRKFRFKNKLLSLDASTIELCASLFDWAKFRQTKGAVKLHMLLDHDGYLPVFVRITEGNVHEVNIAKTLELPAESIVAMDRGYNDYELYYRWTENRIWLVTRLKDNARYEVVKDRPVPRNRNILSDQIICFTGYVSSKQCPIELRRVVVWDTVKQEEIVLLSNLMNLGATTIAAIYKDRWEIEIFFKTLKQNLKIKTFVGTSANALKIQIWTALIAMLLLKYLKFKSSFGWSFSNLVALLHWNLFTYRNLWDWLTAPFGTPPIVPPEQLPLPFLDSILQT
jgi:hypothetical protein